MRVRQIRCIRMADLRKKDQDPGRAQAVPRAQTTGSQGGVALFARGQKQRLHFEALVVRAKAFRIVMLTDIDDLL